MKLNNNTEEEVSGYKPVFMAVSYAVQKGKNMGAIRELLDPIPIPKMALVSQSFDTTCIENVEETLRQELAKEEIAGTVRPGMKIAVTAGSRGIANYVPIMQEIIRFLKEKGAEPFIIPAMGSHGGATVEGQVEILTNYGITEESMGCPIRATMEVVQVGTTVDGRPAKIDRYAAEADGIVVVNRIKPHTAFRAIFESGLMKMLAIGLGKQAGAQIVHENGIYELGQSVEIFSRAIHANTNILFGVGTVENAYDKTCIIRAIPGRDIPEEEPKLLAIAHAKMPSILTDQADVLVIDQIGKEISGEGMDSNVTGRFIVPTIKGKIDVTRLAVLDLTEHSFGNSNGLGLADVCSKRCADKVDKEAAYPNCLTSRVPRFTFFPMIFDTAKLTIQAAIKMVPKKEPEEITMIRIRDTMSLDKILVSENLLDKMLENPNVTLLEGPKEMAFDENGELF